MINFVRTIYPDELHFHPTCHEFHFCIDGKTVFRAEDKYYAFTPGILALAFPRQKHQLLMDKKNAVSFYYLIFTDSQGYADLLLKLNRKFEEEKFCILNNSFKYLFETIRQKIHSNDQFQISSARHQFIAFLYDLLGEEIHTIQDKKSVMVNTAIAIMQSSINKQLTLDELAGRLKRDKSYFIRTFKARMKMPPIKYFNKLKIETACYLLRENKLSIARIADYLCFYDEFHFSHVFKQCMGVSPGKYRKECIL